MSRHSQNCWACILIRANVECRSLAIDGGCWRCGAASLVTAAARGFIGEFENCFWGGSKASFLHCVRDWWLDEISHSLYGQQLGYLRKHSICYGTLLLLSNCIFCTLCPRKGLEWLRVPASWAPEVAVGWDVLWATGLRHMSRRRRFRR